MTAARNRTYHGTDRVLLCRIRLLQRVVNDKVEEQVVSAQRPANFTTPLEMDEELLVHELCSKRSQPIRLRTRTEAAERTFLSSGWDALDMVADDVRDGWVAGEDSELRTARACKSRDKPEPRGHRPHTV